MSSKPKDSISNSFSPAEIKAMVLLLDRLDSTGLLDSIDLRKVQAKFNRMRERISPYGAK
jgi:hypothetical protein